MFRCVFVVMSMCSVFVLGGFIFVVGCIVCGDVCGCDLFCFELVLLDGY